PLRQVVSTMTRKVNRNPRVQVTLSPEAMAVLDELATLSEQPNPAIELEENRIKPKRKGQSKADAAKVAAMLRPRPN
ncbi:hypothetical protein ABVD04_23195, partial [Xanthomonas euvesicatoria]